MKNPSSCLVGSRHSIIFWVAAYRVLMNGFLGLTNGWVDGWMDLREGQTSLPKSASPTNNSVIACKRLWMGWGSKFFAPKAFGLSFCCPTLPDNSTIQLWSHTQLEAFPKLCRRMYSSPESLSPDPRWFEKEEMDISLEEMWLKRCDCIITVWKMGAQIIPGKNFTDVRLCLVYSNSDWLLLSIYLVGFGFDFNEGAAPGMVKAGCRWSFADE